MVSSKRLQRVPLAAMCLLLVPPVGCQIGRFISDAMDLEADKPEAQAMPTFAEAAVTVLEKRAETNCKDLKQVPESKSGHKYKCETALGDGDRNETQAEEECGRFYEVQPFSKPAVGGLLVNVGEARLNWCKASVEPAHWNYWQTSWEYDCRPPESGAPGTCTLVDRSAQQGKTCENREKKFLTGASPGEEFCQGHFHEVVTKETFFDQCDDKSVTYLVEELQVTSPEGVDKEAFLTTLFEQIGSQVIVRSCSLHYEVKEVKVFEEDDSYTRSAACFKCGVSDDWSVCLDDRDNTPIVAKFQGCVSGQQQAYAKKGCQWDPPPT